VTRLNGPLAVTGLGCVSALGLGVPVLWQAVRDGMSGVRPVRLPRDVGGHVKTAAQVDGDVVAQNLPDRLAAQCDPFAQYAILAAEEAIVAAKIDKSELAGHRTAVVIGSGIGGMPTMDDSFANFYSAERGRMNPLTIPRVMPNAAACAVSMRAGARGPCFTIATACSSATQSIGLGMLLIRSGLADRALVGGAEASVTPGSMRYWEVLRVLTSDLARPFSRDRSGMALGEGAGVLLIERIDLARARGAEILALLHGFGTGADAEDLVRPRPEGAAEAMRLAVEDAGLAPNAIDYINAHGTATVLNDAAETSAVRLAFGAAADRLVMSSTKPIHGHALGAAGALELIVTIMALRKQWAPPTINWREPDPKCDIDCVANVGRAMPIAYAMSNSFAFGGINASLVVGPGD
jgi:nodulation protein E